MPGWSVQSCETRICRRRLGWARFGHATRLDFSFGCRWSCGPAFICGTANEHIRPNLPQAPRFTERQIECSFSERSIAQQRPAVVRRTVHDNSPTMELQSIQARRRCDGPLPVTFSRVNQRSQRSSQPTPTKSTSAILIGCLKSTGAPVYVSEMTARFLTPFKKLSVGTRYDNRAASKLEATVSSVGRDYRNRNPDACR